MSEASDLFDELKRTWGALRRPAATVPVPLPLGLTEGIPPQALGGFRLPDAFIPTTMPPSQADPLGLGSTPDQSQWARAYAWGDVQPSSDERLAKAQAEIMENRARQQRALQQRALQEGQQFLPQQLGPAVTPDQEREAARQALARSLQAAIDCGLLSEDRVTAMIVSGGLNDKPLGAEEASELVLTTCAQAVAAGLDLTRLAETVADLAAGRQATASDDEDDAALEAAAERSAPFAGRAVDQADLATLVSAVPTLLGRIRRLQELLYDALRLRPCHESDHADYHALQTRPCREQADAVVGRVLASLDVLPSALPRTVHLNPDGTRAACCSDDGRVGTWLVHGRTRDPSLG